MELIFFVPAPTWVYGRVLDHFDKRSIDFEQSNILSFHVCWCFCKHTTVTPNAVTKIIGSRCPAPCLKDKFSSFSVLW